MDTRTPTGKTRIWAAGPRRNCIFVTLLLGCFTCHRGAPFGNRHEAESQCCWFFTNSWLQPHVSSETQEPPPRLPAFQRWNVRGSCAVRMETKAKEPAKARGHSAARQSNNSAQREWNRSCETVLLLSDDYPLPRCVSLLTAPVTDQHGHTPLGGLGAECGLRWPPVTPRGGTGFTSQWRARTEVWTHWTPANSDQ